MIHSSPEEAVKACYATWSKSYYDDYYGTAASYPPVHKDLLRRVLSEFQPRALLDAGCGPASFLRDITDMGIDLYGFDMTPEMVVEARRVLAERGVNPEHVWQGNALETESYVAPKGTTFDAAVCVGVLPHVEEGTERQVFENLRSAVRPDGLVIVEARNELFSLFTLNRYSHEFFSERLISGLHDATMCPSEQKGVSQALTGLEAMFRMDLPPVRTGKEGEPGYDEVRSRTHNPLELRQVFEAAGFSDVRVLFYHFHCLPPMFAGVAPEMFLRESLRMEETPEDWRGYFMASAFMLAGRRA